MDQPALLQFLPDARNGRDFDGVELVPHVAAVRTEVGTTGAVDQLI